MPTPFVTARPSRRRYAGRLAVVLLVAVMSSVMLSPASPGAAAESPANDGEVTAAAQLIYAAATGSSGPGFGGIEVTLPEPSVPEPSMPDRRIELWWKGPVPQEVTDALAQAPAGVTVQTHAAAWSQAELAPQAHALATREVIVPGPPESVIVYVDAVKPHYDGSGIDVRIIAPLEHDPDPVGGGDNDPPSIPERARAIFQARVSAPVAVELVDTPSVEAGRFNDTSPFSAGAEWRSGPPGNVSACTTGFGVYDFTHPDRHYLLTAEHCQRGAVARNGATPPAVIGTLTRSHPQLDSTLIQVNAVDGLVYDGRLIGADDNHTARMYGSSGNVRGIPICQSGKTSGEVCGLVIKNTRILKWSKTLNLYVRDVVEAHQETGRNAAAPGDSGGPVYSYCEGELRMPPYCPDGEVRAQGIGIQFEARTLLYDSRLYYVDIHELLINWGVRIMPAAPR